MQMQRAVCIALWVSVQGFAQTAVAQRVAARNIANEEQITLVRVAPAGFQNSNFSQESIGALLSNSLPRTIEVKRGDTLSGILKQVFNISKGYTPAIYDEVSRYVLEKNGVPSAKKLKPGFIQIPDLPITGKKDQVPGNPYYAFPRTSSALGGEAMRWDYKSKALLGTPQLDDLYRQAGRTEFQSRTVPLSEAVKYAVPVDKNLGEAQTQHMYVAANKSVQLRVAENGSSCGAYQPVLDGDTAKVLAENMKNKTPVTPLLVILDDSWPDDDEYVKAIRFIADASNVIRAYFKIENPLQDSQDTLVLKGDKKTDFNGVPAFPECKLHSAMIKTALSEFQHLDVKGNVDVIYLPANRAQSGALGALREVMFVSQMARLLGSALGKASISEPARKDAAAFANRIATGLSLAGSISPYDGGPRNIASDKAVVESVAFFLALYSEAAKRPHFLSMSWTVDDLTFQAYFREASFGLMLAAAGNDKGKDAFTDSLQFAMRGVRPGDVLAVLNGDGAALECDSNTLPVDVPTFGIAFPGRISASLCGTSFSTPRVAWLLAARASRGVPVTSINEQKKWPARFKQQIMALQGGDASVQARYFVSARQLLGM